MTFTSNKIGGVQRPNKPEIKEEGKVIVTDLKCLSGYSWGTQKSPWLRAQYRRRAEEAASGQDQTIERIKKSKDKTKLACALTVVS